MTADWELFRRNLDVLVKHEGSLERLAVRTGIPYHTIANWRQRGTKPTLASVLKLARTYKLRADDLIDGRLSAADVEG